MQVTEDIVFKATEEYLNYSYAHSPQYNPISAMRNALAVAVKMMSEWQPIETAPEQTRILVSGWHEPTGTTKGYWWIHESIIWDGCLLDHETAQYWMPLPTPPA